jgi:hypothetical protein
MKKQADFNADISFFDDEYGASSWTGSSPNTAQGQSTARSSRSEKAPDAANDGKSTSSAPKRSFNIDPIEIELQNLKRKMGKS